MLDRDLAQVSAWGQDCIVTFNDRKTKPISVSRSKAKNFPAVHILGMDISSDLSWVYLCMVLLSLPLCVLVACLVLGHSSLPALSCIYTRLPFDHLLSTVRTFWTGASDCYLRMLDKVQRRLCYLVGEDLAVSFDSLGHRRAVGTACLFYRYVFGRCSSGISKLVLPFNISMRETRQSASAHRYTLRSTFWRTTSHESSFFPCATSV